MNHSEKDRRARRISHAVSCSIDEWLPDKIETFGISAAAVGVVTVEENTWSKGFHAVDGGEPQSVDANTVFCVRSLSKAVTALGVLVAVQKGLADLDKPIIEYLPEFTIRTRYASHPERRITLRHLLSNRAGFTHDEPPGNQPECQSSFETRVASIARTWLRFPVGLRYAYSNLHFDLVGHILQKMTGDPFSVFMRENVLEPLGMRASTFDWEKAASSPNLARGHDPTGEVEPIAISEIPSAGLYSTIADMARFLRLHLRTDSADGRRFLQEDLMDEYQAIQFPEPDQETGYCLGICRQLIGSTYSLSHSGGGHGYQSQMIIYPDLAFGIVFLTNKDGHGLTTGPLQKVIDDVVRDETGEEPTPASPAAGGERLPLDDRRLRAVLGRYWDDEHGDWTLDVIEGAPVLKTASESSRPVALYACGDEIIGVCGSSGLMRFAAWDAGIPGMLLWSDRRVRNVVYRMRNGGPEDPSGPSKPEWAAYCGAFDILWKDMPCATERVEVRDGYLYFGDRRCTEHEPGLFFTCDGEAIDLRSNPQTAANLVLRRRG